MRVLVDLRGGDGIVGSGRDVEGDGDKAEGVVVVGEEDKGRSEDIVVFGEVNQSGSLYKGGEKGRNVGAGEGDRALYEKICS